MSPSSSWSKSFLFQPLKGLSKRFHLRQLILFATPKIVREHICFTTYSQPFFVLLIGVYILSSICLNPFACCRREIRNGELLNSFQNYQPEEEHIKALTQQIILKKSYYIFRSKNLSFSLLFSMTNTKHIQ